MWQNVIVAHLIQHWLRFMLYVWSKCEWMASLCEVIRIYLMLLWKLCNLNCGIRNSRFRRLTLYPWISIQNKTSRSSLGIVKEFQLKSKLTRSSPSVLQHQKQTKYSFTLQHQILCNNHMTSKINSVPQIPYIILFNITYFSRCMLSNTTHQILMKTHHTGDIFRLIL
jgi:hypothetical protein